VVSIGGKMTYPRRKMASWGFAFCKPNVEISMSCAFSCRLKTVLSVLVQLLHYYVAWAQIYRYCLKMYPKICHKIILRQSYAVVRWLCDIS